MGDRPLGQPGPDVHPRALRLRARLAARQRPRHELFDRVGSSRSGEDVAPRSFDEYTRPDRRGRRRTARRRHAAPDGGLTRMRLDSPPGRPRGRRPRPPLGARTPCSTATARGAAAPRRALRRQRAHAPRRLLAQPGRYGRVSRRGRASAPSAGSGSRRDGFGSTGVADLVEFQRDPARRRAAQPSSRSPSPSSTSAAEAPLGQRRRPALRPGPLPRRDARCRGPRGGGLSRAEQARREVEFTADLRAETEDAVARLHALLASADEFPPAVLKPQCRGCSLRGHCLPEAFGQPGPQSPRYLRRPLPTPH